MKLTPSQREARRALARSRRKVVTLDFAVEQIAEPTQGKPSVHLVRRAGPSEYRHLFLADLHLDHPDCLLDQLRQDLDEAVRVGATISIHGDLFDAMQGRDDPRRSHGSMLPGLYGKPAYFDELVKLAVEFLSPYAQNIVLISDGNHETEPLKRYGTDLIGRVVDELTRAHGYRGGRGWYQGWLILQQIPGQTPDEPRGNGSSASVKVFYHHGGGGSAARSRGTLDLMKMADQVEGADVLVSGHLHVGAQFPLARYGLNNKFRPVTRTLLLGRTGTYKDDSGSGGWGVQKRIGPPTIGGLWLDYLVATRHDEASGGRGLAIDMALRPTRAQAVR